MAKPPLEGQSTDPKVPGVKGENTVGGGYGVWGSCDAGHGVHGDSQTSRGVVGTSKNFHGVFGKSVNNVGVAGESNSMYGVLGVCTGPAGFNGSGAGVRGENTNSGGFGVSGFCANGHGVHGDSQSSRGVVGTSQGFQGVFGHSQSNVGVAGESESMYGVLGVGKSATGAGVVGQNVVGDGVVGRGRRGVVGESDAWQGVYGHSRTNAGVVGESDEFDGVWGKSHRATAAGVSGHNVAGGLAGFFEGDVAVTGDIRLLGGADCAEDFDIAGDERIDAGTVMVLGPEGALVESRKAYDKCVAGVVSGAGEYRPGIVLDKQVSTSNRQPIALLGKVFCKVDAQFGAIEVGDMLTSSPTPGHAMKTSDPSQAFGAVIGKALRPFAAGQGLIPILIALQ